MVHVVSSGSGKIFGSGSVHIAVVREIGELILPDSLLAKKILVVENVE